MTATDRYISKDSGGYVVRVPGHDGKRRSRRARTLQQARRVRDALVRGLKVGGPPRSQAAADGQIGFMAGVIAEFADQYERDCPNPRRCELRRQAWVALSRAGWRRRDLVRLFAAHHGKRFR